MSLLSQSEQDRQNKMKTISLLFVFQLWAGGGLEVDCQGSLVMIGGNLREDNIDIWSRMVNLSSPGEGGVRIGVITAANSEAAYWGEYYVEMFQRFGGQAVWLEVILEDPSSPYSQENVRIIQSCSGIFLGGGEPWRLVLTLMEVSEDGGRGDTPVLAAIKSVRLRGGMIAATSAGIEALSDSVIVTGGYSWEALTYGASEASNGTDSRNLTYDPLGGLGVINNILVDAHFRARGRYGRLTRLLADTRTSDLALGVDEDTALVCEVAQQVEKCEIIGSGGVWLLSLPPSDCGESESVWRCGEVLTSLLTHNDLITLTPPTWTLHFADWKQEVEEAEGVPETTEDVFGTTFNDETLQYEYDRVVHSLLTLRTNQTFGLTREKDPRGYKLRFRKVAGPLLETTGHTEAVKYQHFLSYKNLLVDFTPI